MENTQKLSLAECMYPFPWSDRFHDSVANLAAGLDDLCVRFIINLPHEELEGVDRTTFHIEEAHWFYEDFARVQDPSLRSMSLKEFADEIFKHCPLFSAFTEEHRRQAFDMFLAYKVRVPVRGAILLDETMEWALLVKGWKKNAKWSFPRGKILKDEDDFDCAVREVYEETGFDVSTSGLVIPGQEPNGFHLAMREQDIKLYPIRGVPFDFPFAPRTRKEISKIDWYRISDLPTAKRNKQQANGPEAFRDNKFYMVAPFLKPLKRWIAEQKAMDAQRPQSALKEESIETSEQNMKLAPPGELTASHTAPQAAPQADSSFDQLIANLGRQRTSDALPEVSLQSNPIPDPALELKRLLSVNRMRNIPPTLSFGRTKQHSRSNRHRTSARRSPGGRPTKWLV